MADLPFPAEARLRRRLHDVVDVEGKIPATLEALGPVAGRDVVLFDAERGWRVRQLAGLGARVVALADDRHIAALRWGLRAELGARSVRLAVGTPLANELPDGSADAVVSFWTGFRGGSDAEVAEAERILRPRGRLLVVHEYARDDVSRFRPEEVARDAVDWSRRDGWFLRHGFKIHVIHAWWTFAGLEPMRKLVVAVFGPDAPSLLADVRRPRLSWKVAFYHRYRLAGGPPGGP